MPPRTTYPPPSITPTAAGTVTALKATRTGTFGMLLTDLTKTVTFTPALPSTNYQVTLEFTGAIAASMGIGSKTVTSFNVLSVGVASSALWVATEL